ncbi:delta-aminolevulinic acid dehydratase-like [Watersipora subatra]|uniref:delta-aminolevulinic acid dehydratase-like n=1 Tax=Watersipora subatra TaxID=2589382 RepID=UPI00355B902E
MADFLHSSYHHPILRSWSNSATLSLVDSLVYPVFISENNDCDESIDPLPGQRRLGINKLKGVISSLISKGLKSVLLFGVLTSLEKDEQGSAASSDDNPVIKALPILREAFPNLLLICDVCLCAYTSHGHCGVFTSDGVIDPKESMQAIARVALAYAKAGAHVVAPSDMMDCRIKAIKDLLQDENMINRVAVMSYSAKFASSFYGPFRAAAQSAPSFGDRKAYQLPPMSRGLAIRATGRDVSEGADILMVKPGMAYLDIVRDIKNAFPHHPLAIYQVSGEYAMLYHAAQNSVFDLQTVVMETVGGMKRAGADIIITYFTPQILSWLEEVKD